MPSFTQVLDAIHEAYTTRRADLIDAAGKLTGALDRAALGIGGSDGDLNASLLDQTVSRYAQRFDARFGGFDGAPKFPQPMNLEFLLRQHKRTGDAHALHMVTHTLEQMARGGIYDQIAGGFARYATDARWLVPHFEKMLYDNAQLSRVYLHAWQVTGNGYFRQIAVEVYDYVLREMTAPEGGFYSATDADSEGVEGKFFVWSQDEIEALLGEDVAIAIELYGITRGGNFEGHNILYLPNDEATAAERLGLDDAAMRDAVSRIRDTLYAARTQRVAPGLDDKVVTAWNGMMLASLAEAARVLGRSDYATAALRAGAFIRDRLITGGDRLLRTYKDGQSKLNGYLEDYASVIDGLLELYQLTFDDAWFTLARRLADRVLAHFGADEGGFFDTSDDHESLIVRPRNVQDNAVPSGSGLMSVQLIRLAAYTGDPRYDDAARGGLRLLTNAITEFPQAFAVSATAIDMLVTGVQELALIGDPADTGMQALLDVVTGAYRPNLVVALAAVDVDGAHDAIPLLDARTQRDSRPTAYVCEHFTCQLPVTTPDALEGQLR
jgi:uncharacterized protein YyaL (SSP411 family)